MHNKPPQNLVTIGSLSAWVKGIHGPWASHHPPSPGFFTLLSSRLKSSKRGKGNPSVQALFNSLLASHLSLSHWTKFHLQGHGQCGRRYRQTWTNCSCYCDRQQLQWFTKSPSSSLEKYLTTDKPGSGMLVSQKRFWLFFRKSRNCLVLLLE